MKRMIKSAACLILILILSITSLPAGLAGGSVQAAQKTYSLNKTIKHMSRKAKLVLKVSGGAKKVKWSSSNKKVATVKKKSKTRAVVTAKSAGTCKIYAKIGDTTLSCVIQVTDSTKKAGTFKNGAFYIKKQKVYTVKDALSSSGGSLNFHGAHYLYIGASRTKNTANAVQDSDVYFYSYSGCGIDCLFRKMFSDNKWKAPGLKVIDSFLQIQPSGTVLIDLGGNDLRNIKAYIGLYRYLIQKYPSADFRFIGVLPRQDGTNKSRVKFNQQLVKAFPTRVIDLYSYVLNHPLFDTVDGVHYAPVLSRIIYEKTMQAIGRRITVDVDTGAVSLQTQTSAEPAKTQDPEETQQEESESVSQEEGSSLPQDALAVQWQASAEP